MKTSRGKKLRPSKDQVRAWLTTVIAPIGSALAVEQERVARGNWSFRCETQDFEFLWPIERMISVRYAPNLGQLFRYRNDLKKLVHAHDSGLMKLLNIAKVAYDRLIHSDRFRSLASSVSVAESDRKDLAEYVLNGVRDLPSHYVHHDVWAREGGKFLDLREDPSVSSDFRSLSAAGQSFAKSVNELRTAVSTLQIELADEYKLPPVDPADTLRV